MARHEACRGRGYTRPRRILRQAYIQAWKFYDKDNEGNTFGKIKDLQFVYELNYKI